MIKAVVFLHIVSATIWTGEHLILSLGFLPAVLKRNNFSIIKAFESRYERIGIPALVLLVAIGVYMTSYYNIFKWNWSNHYTKHIVLKFTTLFITIALVLHARLVLIPKRNLKPLGVHIIAVTLLSVFFMLLGCSARSGGIF